MKDWERSSRLQQVWVSRKRGYEYTGGFEEPIRELEITGGQRGGRKMKA